MKLAINPTIETIFPSGALCLSDIVQDEYFAHTYYGYTRAEAKAEFREMVREFFEQQITAR